MKILNQYAVYLQRILVITGGLFDCSCRTSSSGAFLVAQWLRIWLPMKETQVQPLVLWKEESTCWGAVKPLHHSHSVHVPRSLCSAVRSHKERRAGYSYLRTPRREWPPLATTREEPTCSNKDPVKPRKQKNIQVFNNKKMITKIMFRKVAVK